MTMKYMVMRLHYHCLAYHVRSSVKNTRQRFLYLDVLYGRQKAIVNDVFEKFRDRFGFCSGINEFPTMDADQ